MKILSSFTKLHVILKLYDLFSSVEQKKDILKNVGNQTFLVSIVFFVHTMEVYRNQNCLVTNILQNIFFIFKRRPILEWHKGEQIDTIFIFGWTISVSEL